MTNIFRAWDGKQYWYSDNKLFFHGKGEARCLHEAPFSINALEAFTGKVTSSGVKIFENDIITNPFDSADHYQVVWSPNDCGFKKVKFGHKSPLTNLSGAFFEVVGTIHD